MATDQEFLAFMAARVSVPKVGPGAPTDEELGDLLRAVAPVADHASLRPWRFITLRGDDRTRLGLALDEAEGISRPPEKAAAKPNRAELLIALVGIRTEHHKVPEWEQLATAAGAGHLLELALAAAGWGAMWRSGKLTNAEPVRRLHGLAENELLMGWIYVGRPLTSGAPKSRPDPRDQIGPLPR